LLLHLKDAVSGYGSGEVLHGVTVSIDEGEMVSLIGPNGAGKSTILRTISGLLKLRKGQKILNDRDISNLPSPKVSKLGIAQVPEGRLIFSPLTVLQNLLLGCYPMYRKLGENGREKLLQSVYEIFPILLQRHEQLAGTLSGGEQQMLAIGRALMAEPKLLLLDEPSLGLAPLIVESIFDVLSSLKERGMTILLAEQNAMAALGMTDRAYLVEEGQIALEGESKEMAQDARVKEAYLGGAG
jgi:branched-chain amino acid transport system ATP-binding protein